MRKGLSLCWLLLGLAGANAAADPAEPTTPSPLAASDPDPAPVTFQSIVAQARALGAKPYVAPEQLPQETATKLDYDAYRRIEFRRSASDWTSGPATQVHTSFDPAGYLFVHPIRINLLYGTMPRARPFDQAEFDFHDLPLSVEERASLGYGGFSLTTPLNASGRYDAFISFRGASFFRALGMDNRWGASARGLAVATASPFGEEFPLFREFWLKQPAPGDRYVTIYATLDSPSLAGAYRFVVSPGAQTRIDVSAYLFPRRTVTEAGLAPITSMFDLAPHDPAPAQQDFRPRVHDSEGLSIHARSGEWIWRPLLNPQRLEVSSFTSEPPLGFGLMQRERRFSAYEDLEARYDLRPSVWVQPRGDWPAGQVLLVEIPTGNEFNDNIVAFFRPQTAWNKGEEIRIAYSLYWGMEAPAFAPILTVAGTLVGNAVNSDRPIFVIDYAKGDGETASEIKPEVSASVGKVIHPVVLNNTVTGGLRLTFELEPAGTDPVELRSVLRRAGKVVSETWLFRWRPR